MNIRELVRIPCLLFVILKPSTSLLIFLNFIIVKSSISPHERNKIYYDDRFITYLYVFIIHKLPCDPKVESGNAGSQLICMQVQPK